MITNFWDWMYTSVNNALSVLNTLYNNSTMKPFFDLLLVIVGIGVIMKFILAPLLGFGIVGASDRAADEYNRKQKNKPQDAEYRSIK